MLFEHKVEKPASADIDSTDRIDRTLEPGVDLAVMLTAASRTARALVWPADIPETGDLADAFRARLDALAKRAHIHGMPRYAAAAGIAELAVAPATRPDVSIRPTV